MGLDISKKQSIQDDLKNDLKRAVTSRELGNAENDALLLARLALRIIDDHEARIVALEKNKK